MPNRIRDDLHKVDENTYSYIYEENATVQLKSNDGLVRCNVYRPKNIPKAPVIITYGPYGKDVPYGDFLKHSFDEIDEAQKSEQSAFEVPDPKFWTNEGYAVVRADEVGIGQSPGVVDTMSKKTTDAFQEVIEWAAEQSWSNGKVALLGISYFAGTQWRVAARRPKGLVCILPYEGMADYYRDRSRHAGIVTNKFLNFWYNRQIKPNQYGVAGKASRNWGPDTLEGDLDEEELKNNRREQPADNNASSFRDEIYYASKEYNLEDIEVPILSFGNWGNINCHLRGNVLGYMYGGSDLKFLRMGTGRHDLPFYSKEEVEIQKSFMSAFCKDDDYAGWTSGKQPPVHLTLRRSGVEINNPEAAKAFEQRDETSWPLERTQYTKFYLTPDNELTTDVPSSKSFKKLSYSALGTYEDPKFLHFSTKPAEEPYEVTGHIVATLNVSATPTLTGASIPRDIDVFLTLRHFNAEGKENFYTGTIGDPVPVCKGWVRASLRKVNKEHTRHREWLPYRDYFSTDVQPVMPGEIYAIDIEMWPTCVQVQKGERLVFEVSSGDTQGAGIFCHDGAERSEERFGGVNHIHFGPTRLNYVTLPIIPKA